MNVRELIEHLQNFDSELLVVVEGSEWDLPAGGTDRRWWQRTTEAGTPTGESPREVAFITLDPPTS